MGGRGGCIEKSDHCCVGWVACCFISCEGGEGCCGEVMGELRMESCVAGWF